MFRGFQVGYDPASSAAGGTMLFARAQFADRSPTGVDDPGVPLVFRLSDPYPNPFNPSTSILLDLPERGDVRIAVYDVIGREVAVLMDGQAGPGRSAVQWDGRDARGRAVASGVYLVRATAVASGGGGSMTAVRKLLLAK
jgi:hypothetical protein